MLINPSRTRANYAAEHGLPHYGIVPKDPLANLAFRRAIWERAADDPEFQYEQKLRCARDILYFVNTYCVLFEPRPPLGPAVFPFLTFDFQDDTLLEMDKRLGKRDIPIEKSRDMGATFMAVAGVCLRRWLFFPRESFLLVSRTKELVDGAENDVDTIFFKLDLQMKYLPSWMVPLHTRTAMHLGNRENLSVFDGEATTENIGRAGRRLAIFIDELGAFKDSASAGAWAATMKSTRCRIVVGTPGGAHGQFYEMMNPQPGEPSVDKITLHWRSHPLQNRGMYQYRDGKLEILDKDYAFPEDYEFINDGKLRSVPYDDDQRRGMTPQQMAQEWDIEYVGSGFPVWQPDRVRNAEFRDSRPAIERGDLRLVNETEAEVERFVRNESGHLSLWIPLAADGRPPKGEYVLGADISMGVGVTPSCAEIFRRNTREQVGEIICYQHDPKEFATLCVAVCRWFWDALLNWETNGPGGWFTNQVRRTNYARLWYRPVNEDERRSRRTRKMGWHSNNKSGTRDADIGQFGTDVLDGNIICRSSQLFREMLHYRSSRAGYVSGSIPRGDGMDPTTKPENHGDCVIGGVAAHKAMGPLSRIEKPVDPKRRDNGVPMSSLAYRRGLRKETAREAAEQARWR